MKRLLKKIIGGVCVMSLLCSMAIIPTFAADDIHVQLDGVELTFDVPPQIIDDYTMVPMRAIFEALGYEVDWNQDDKSINATMGNSVILMNIGNNSMFVGKWSEYENTTNKNSYISNNTRIIDKAPQIIDGRTLVPVRAISEASGYNVSWNGDTRTVIITSPIKTVTYYANTDIPTYDSIEFMECEYSSMDGGTSLLSGYINGARSFVYPINSDKITEYVSTLINDYGCSRYSLDNGIALISPQNNAVSIKTLETTYQNYTMIVVYTAEDLRQEDLKSNSSSNNSSTYTPSTSNSSSESENKENSYVKSQISKTEKEIKEIKSKIKNIKKEISEKEKEKENVSNNRDTMVIIGGRQVPVGDPTKIQKIQDQIDDLEEELDYYEEKLDITEDYLKELKSL